MKGIASRRSRQTIILGLMSALLTTFPVKAAEEILIRYGPVQLDLQISSLEAFAEDGTVNRNLRTYLRGTTPEQQAAFRRALVEKATVDPVLIYRLFNTDIGEGALQFFGDYVQLRGGINGKYALRGAIIQASLDPEGLTLLNFLRRLPPNVELNVNQLLKLSDFIDIVVRATANISQDLATLSQKEAQQDAPVNYAQLTDLRQPGPYGFVKERWNLTDSKRQRSFYVEFYQPQRWRKGETPVIIFSHGLASRPEDFDKQVAHLTSYGYVVAVPQHPGSDLLQVQNLLAGYSGDVFNRNEFIERNTDISFVIDELERRNNSQFGGRLNLDAVGVMGHSFGGYTALAVAGATIDFDYLQQTCKDNRQYLNISLLLQCQALKLPRQEYNFRDPRVKAVLAANPVNSGIFGPQGLAKIEIPVFIGAGSYDPATPFVFEQARSFPWLETSDKYLGMVEGQAHVDFSILDAGITELLDTTDILLPSPTLINDYANAIAVAFFEVYIAGDEDYQPYLQASYSSYLSQGEPFKFYIITDASSEQLRQDLLKFRGQYGY